METKLNTLLSNLKWKLRLVENQIMTAQKLEFRSEMLHLQQIVEVLKNDCIYPLETIIDDTK